MPKVKPVPTGYEGIIPNLCLENAAKAIEFYKKAFGATSEECMKGEDGKVMHAEVKIGQGVIMLSDAFPEWNCHPSKNARLFFYVPDVDKVVAQAVKAGCKIEQPVQDQFWGDRMGKVTDPFGVSWGVATHKEDLTPEQVKERGAEWMAKMAAASTN